MTRHFLAAALAGLVALAAPGAARAQAAGQVVPLNEDAGLINGAECLQSQAQTLELDWFITPTGAFTSGVYQVYASDVATDPATGTTPVTCFTKPDTNHSPPVTAAGKIGPDIDAFPTDTQRSHVFDTWEFPAKAGYGSCIEQADQPIYVCVQLSVGGANFGAATGRLTLSTGRPSTPISLSLRVGDTRLYGSWKAGSAGVATTQNYELVATPVAEVGLPDGQRPGERSATSTGTSGKVDGLVNGKEYQLVAYALSKAGTRSDGSAAQNGTPSPVEDFWDVYQGGAGAEQGGCGGPAGPLALVAAALALVAARRRS